MQGKNFLSQFSAKRIVLFLTVFVFLHLTFTLVYLYNTGLAEKTAKRDELIQKIINTIYLVEATPDINREKAVAALEDPDLHISLTSKPKGERRFQVVSFWDINRALKKRLSTFSFSIQMEKSQWLNINAKIYSHVLLSQLLIICAEILVFGTILISAWSIARFTKPLEQVKLMAENLGIDLHAKPIKEIYAGPSVVREATQAMNRMQERIQDLIRDRTQMLAAISHDLRTPITRMKLRSQFFEDEELQTTFIRDLDEMEKMITEILAFARDESSTEKKVRVDLVSILQTITDEQKDMGCDVELLTEKNHFVVSGRPMALKRAFMNLVNNGVRYGDRVKISLRVRTNNVVVKIVDAGPGIPEDEMDQVFAPFYRGERSRSRDTGGVGLGLAVTRDIIRAHGGQIRLRNEKPHGLCVTVRFQKPNITPSPSGATRGSSL